MRRVFLPEVHVVVGASRNQPMVVSCSQMYDSTAQGNAVGQHPHRVALEARGANECPCSSQAREHAYQRLAHVHAHAPATHHAHTRTFPRAQGRPGHRRPHRCSRTASRSSPSSAPSPRGSPTETATCPRGKKRGAHRCAPGASWTARGSGRGAAGGRPGGSWPSGFNARVLAVACLCVSLLYLGVLCTVGSSRQTPGDAELSEIGLY